MRPFLRVHEAEAPHRAAAPWPHLSLAYTMHVRMQAGALDIAIPAERTWMELLPG